MKLADGTIIPSNSTPVSSKENSIVSNTRFNNYALRIGSVTDIIDPRDPRNFNKKVTEYEVVCNQVDGNNTTSATTYRCTLAASFGGIADYMDYGLRYEAKSYNNNAYTHGSSVLVLCANGRSSQSYIIGGALHPLKNPEFHDSSIYYDFEYNGIHIGINVDGEYTITQKGPSSISGTYDTSSIAQNSSNLSYIKIDKNGGMMLYCDSQSLQIDRLNDTVELIGGASGIGISTKGKIDMETSGLSLHTPGTFATESFMRGTTYRFNQILMHQNIQTSMAGIAAAASAASASLATAAAFHVIPIVGAMIGAPFVLAASTSMATVASLSAAIQAEIVGFEADSIEYVSQEHSLN